MQVDSSKFLCHLVKFVAARIFSSQISIYIMRYGGSSLEFGALRANARVAKKRTLFFLLACVTRWAP